LTGAVARSMAFNAARVAGAGERAHYTGIGAIGLVVANLAAIIALSGEATAACRRVCAVAGEVTRHATDTTGLITSIASAPGIATASVGTGIAAAVPAVAAASASIGIPRGITASCSGIPGHD